MDLVLPGKMEKFEYRGWEVEVAWLPMPQPFDSAPRDFPGSIPAAYLGHMNAIKVAKGKPGFDIIRQPLWLTREQMEKIKTELDLASAYTYILDMGRKRMEASIDNCESGRHETATHVDPPPDLDPRTDLADPRLRIKVEPDGVKINPPV